MRQHRAQRWRNISADRFRTVHAMAWHEAKAEGITAPAYQTMRDLVSLNAPLAHRTLSGHGCYIAAAIIHEQEFRMMSFTRRMCR
jgi:hypothetical protein